MLGAETVLQQRRQSGAAAARFKSRFEAVFHRAGEPALAWREESGRLVLSAERLALREGLVALSRELFAIPVGSAALPAAAPAPLGWDARKLEQALACGDMRQRFLTEGLPKFPLSARQPIARLTALPNRDAAFWEALPDGRVMASGADGKRYLACRSGRFVLPAAACEGR